MNKPKVIFLPHANIQYSQLAPERRQWVMKNCYEKLFDLIKNFVETVGFCGMIDIDIFKCGGEYYISEVNPRFGGGYPHAYECGVNMPAQIIRNLEGKANEERIGAYEENVYMMKYNEIMLLHHL